MLQATPFHLFQSAGFQLTILASVAFTILSTSLLQLALKPLETGLAGCPLVCCNWPSTLCGQDWLVAHLSVATGPLPSVDRIGWMPTSLLQLAIYPLYSGLAGCPLVCCYWPSTLCIQDWLMKQADQQRWWPDHKMCCNGVICL